MAITANNVLKNMVDHAYVLCCDHGKLDTKAFDALVSNNGILEDPMALGFGPDDLVSIWLVHDMDKPVGWCIRVDYPNTPEEIAEGYPWYSCDYPKIGGREWIRFPEQQKRKPR